MEHHRAGSFSEDYTLYAVRYVYASTETVFTTPPCGTEQPAERVADSSYST